MTVRFLGKENKTSVPKEGWRVTANAKNCLEELGKGNGKNVSKSIIDRKIHSKYFAVHSQLGIQNLQICICIYCRSKFACYSDLFLDKNTSVFLVQIYFFAPAPELIMRLLFKALGFKF